MAEKFHGSFTQQLPIPDDAIAAAVGVMKHGRLHRYNVAEGEIAEAALLEQDFAASIGAKYCLAVASGGFAMAAALRAAGVAHGDPVLSNAFTLAPVPGAIASVGGVPVFVEVTDELLLDFDDLSGKIDATGARYLLLSHMRGHICDMDRLMALCTDRGVTVIEDCAHTMGGAWRDVPTGRFGKAGCFSTQTYKHMNSGEGGFLITDDDELMARATVLSGSYMLYARHGAGPPDSAFDAIRLETPNCSGRMDNLRAAILRPQIKTLKNQCDAWNSRYRVVEDELRNTAHLKVIERADDEHFVGSSIQFLLPDFSTTDIVDIVSRCAVRGVELKWFGSADPVGFTSRYTSWEYAPKQTLRRTNRVLDGLMDMRLPLTFSLEDCALIARIIRDEVSTTG